MIGDSGMALSLSTLAVIVLALVFAFLNGVVDSGSMVAAAVASRSLTPRQALLVASVAEFIGPFLFGTAVAATIATGIIGPKFIVPNVVLAALVGAIAWNVIALVLGVPTSSSHALVGGLVGAGIAYGGPEAVIDSGVTLVAAALIVGPALALLTGFLTLNVILAGARGASPIVNRFFKRAQIWMLVLLALSHGTNDAQKTMGVIVLVLVAAGAQAEFAVPLWVTAMSALALSLGVLTGGQRVVRTIGSKLYRIRPVHGFSSQASAGIIILAATLLGAPTSTGQVVSGSIIGVGTAYRVSAVRWAVARNIVVAWAITIPFAALAAAASLWVLSQI
jgi:inorganic phosphate transporter, PiT family